MLFGKALSTSALAASILMAGHLAPAQVAVSIGEPPVCPYGYFNYPPYDCAPYGYYGPDWFAGGLFIGAGPWFHSPRPGWYGHVDNRYDPHFGYHGPLPNHGEAAFNHFHGNQAIDGRGGVGNPGHDAGGEHAAGFAGHGAPGGGGHGGGRR